MERTVLQLGAGSSDSLRVLVTGYTSADIPTPLAALQLILAAIINYRSLVKLQSKSELACSLISQAVAQNVWQVVRPPCQSPLQTRLAEDVTSDKEIHASPVAVTEQLRGLDPSQAFQQGSVLSTTLYIGPLSCHGG